MVAIQFNKTQNFFQVHQYFSIYRWYLFFFKQNLNISHEYLIQHSFKWVKFLVLPHFKWVKYLVLPHFKWVKYLVLPHFDRPVNLTGTRQPKSLANFKPAPHFSHNIDLSMGVMLKDRNDEWAIRFVLQNVLRLV
jgi:hypothetical protein